MQYCTACQKAIATYVVMDLSGGSVTGSQHVCAACAEQLGVAPPKAPKYSAEILEDLLSGLHGAAVHGPGELTGRRRERPATENCPGCGMSPSDFRQRGRLGCPRCYEAFRHELLPLLQRIHESQTHCGRLPSLEAIAPSGPDEQELGDLRNRLDDAVRGERYEEAARLRDELRQLERGADS